MPGPPARSRSRSREDATARYRRVFLDRDRAVELGELLARAWPPRSVVELDGWRLRTGPGLPAHATSAWPRAGGQRVPLHVRIDGTARHYDQAGLPPRVLVSRVAQPAGVDAALAERGWARTGDADLRTGPVEAGAALEPAGDVTVDAVARDEWLAAFAEVTGRSREQAAGAAASLARVDAPSCYLLCRGATRVAGVARALVDGGWMGLPDLAVAGGDADVAAALARSAADWADAGGVRHLWWLVPRGDAAAGEAARRARLHPDLTLHLREGPATGGGRRAATSRGSRA